MLFFLFWMCQCLSHLLKFFTPCLTTSPQLLALPPLHVQRTKMQKGGEVGGRVGGMGRWKGEMVGEVGWRWGEGGARVEWRVECFFFQASARINKIKKKTYLIYFYLFYLSYLLKFPALFGKGTQVRINIYYSGGSLENKRNQINQIYVYADLSSFPKRTWKFNKWNKKRQNYINFFFFSFILFILSIVFILFILFLKLPPEKIK